MKIHPQVTTRKILLVGHSQGTFYTNELYRYLTTHGVPKESIGVYNIATPATYVEGGGAYVTSTNDKIINLVRNTEVDGNVSLYLNSYYVINPIVGSALRANITVPKESGYDRDDFGGHKLSVYLDGAAPRIMGDIDAALRRLRASGGSTEGSCFEPPEEDLAYKAKSLAYAVVDPFASGTKAIASSIKGGAIGFTDYVADGVNETKYFAQSLFKNLASTETSPKSQVAIAILATPSITAKPVQQNPSKPPASTVPKKVAVTLDQANPITESAESTEPRNLQKESEVASTPMPAPITPGFGGGGEAAVQTVVQDPALASLAITTPVDNAAFATTTVNVVGTADIDAAITLTVGSASATTTADGAGNWSFELSLLEGISTVTVRADIAGKESATLSREITVDLTPPAAPTLAVAECVVSIVSGLCVLPNTSVNLEWSGSNADHYSVYKDDAFVVTVTSTSSVITISTNATSSTVVVAYDLAGNAATSSAVTAYATTQPIIINEIGWGGTDTGVASGQQWIEIKNVTGFPIDLSHVGILRSNGETISLAGASIPARQALVIEQTDLQISGPNEFITPFTDLPTNAAEQLALVWQGVTIDATPSIGTCASWCKGEFYVQIGSNVSGFSNTIASLSMERITNASDGTLAASWQSTDSYGPSDSPAGGKTWGTPGVENTYGFPDAGVYCGTVDNMIVSGGATVPFDTGSGICTYLSRFITGDLAGARRFGALLQGTVGSSTSVTGHSFAKNLAFVTQDHVPSGTPVGTEFFYAIYETPTFIDGVALLFTQYFEHGTDPLNGGNPPPHGNYVTIPFVYQP